MYSVRSTPRAIIGVALTLGLGCARSQSSLRSDSATGNVAVPATAAAADTASRTGASRDPAMSGMTAGMSSDSAHMAMMTRKYGAPKDADHDFLRMMSDHHQGLIAMAAPAMNQGTSAETKSDAATLQQKQTDERDRMLAMIKSRYGESYEPMVMPSNQAMLDSLQRATGAQFDHQFYHDVVAHHRQAIAMIDKYQSRLQNAELRSMADRMRADQQREITEFERKAGARQ